MAWCATPSLRWRPAIMETRFHNPYRHWVIGLAFEVAFIAGFIAVTALLALGAAWLA
jgi:hypothetical protein